MQPKTTDYLQSNLRALAQRAPELAARLCAAVDSCFDDGKALLLAVSPRDVQRQLEVYTDSGAQYLIGAGLGELVGAALAVDSSRELIVWDADPFLLREALRGTNYRQALRQGQLRLLLGVDVLDELNALKDANAAQRVIWHPKLERYWRHLKWIVERQETGPRALVCDGGLFVDDVTDSLRQRGYQTWLWGVDGLSADEVLRTMRGFAPDLLVAVNFREGLAETASRHQTPLLVWEIDPSTNAVRPPVTPTSNTAIFTYRRANIAEYEKAGFERVEFLPLAANVERRQPTKLSDDDHRLSARVSFVGASLDSQAKYYRELFIARLLDVQTKAPSDEQRNTLSARLDDLLRRQAENFRTFIIPELLEELFPELGQVPRDSDNSHDQEHRLEYLVAEIAGRDKRRRYVESLADQGIAVWGDAGWQSAKCDYRGEAGHLDELTTIYSNSLINIDIDRIYQSEIVTMRVFDVLSCGGFLLTPASSSPGEFFEIGRELVTYDDAHDLKAQVEYYLNHPDEAAAIGAAGRARVVRDHSIDSRVEIMLAALENK